MARIAPLLKDFEHLEKQFNWLIDGSISEEVTKNLLKEVGNLDEYLRSLQRTDLNTILDEYVEKDHKYPESGRTCSWIGVFRAAEMLWGTSKDFSIFRLEEEGVKGSSPQIIVKEWNR